MYTFRAAPKVQRTRSAIEYSVVLIPLLWIEFALILEGMLGMNVPGSVRLFSYFWRTKALKTTDPWRERGKSFRVDSNRPAVTIAACRLLA